jgi:hypothetical protein
MTREQELDSIRQLVQQLQQMQSSPHADPKAIERLSDDIISLQTNMLLNDLFCDD